MFVRFEQFLIGSGTIGPKQSPYYVISVKDCYSFCQIPDININPT